MYVLVYARVARVHPLQQAQQVTSADGMRRADVPAGGCGRLVEQEQRVGDVADVDDVPELVPYPVRPPCIGIQNIIQISAAKH